MREGELVARPAIPRVVSLQDGELVPVRNGSEARWAIDTTGRRWVRKRELHTTADGLLAEAICYLLGRELDIPQANGAVHRDEDGEWSWLSEAVPGVQHWEPVLADRLVNGDGLGRILALDAIVHNHDRHPGNLLVQFLGDEAHARVWSIDFGNALVGKPSVFAREDLGVPPAHPDMRGLPVAAVAGSARAAAVVASLLPDSRLSAIVTEACSICGEPMVEELTAALVRRHREAVRLVADYLDVLGAAP